LKKKLIKPKGALEFTETRLIDVSTTNDAIWAGEQEGQKLKKRKKKRKQEGKKRDLGVITLPIREHVSAERTKTKFGIRSRVTDVIICFKFYRNRLRGFRAVMGQNGGLLLTLTVLPVMHDYALFTWPLDRPSVGSHDKPA